MEPHDDFEASLLCAPPGPAPGPEPPTPPQVTPCLMPSDLRPCLADGPYSACQQRLEQQQQPPLSCSSSPNTSPKLYPLAPSPYSQYTPAGPPQPCPTPTPTPHVSIIQETPGRLQQPAALHPPGSASSSSPTSQPSSPASGSERPLSSAQLVPRAPSRLPPSLHKDGSPPSLTVSVKQEPQELDQMYLDDVNEIIRNDLSSISAQSSV